MAQHDRSSTALVTVISIVLGIGLAVLLALGLHLLYPQPSGSAEKLKTLNEQQQALDSAKQLTGGKMSRKHEQYAKRITDRITSEKKALEDGLAGWNAKTSLILAAIGVLLMVAGLALATRAAAVASGLFASGVSTALYGGYVSLTGPPTATRYAIPAVVVLLTLALGYLAFVRPRRRGESPAS